MFGTQGKTGRSSRPAFGVKPQIILFVVDANLKVRSTYKYGRVPQVSRFRDLGDTTRYLQ